MEYFLRFYYPILLYILVPAVLLITFLRLKWAKGVLYNYSMGKMLKDNHFASRHPYKKFFFLTRFLSLVTLAILIARPQLVDPRSNVLVEGIDMMLVLDVSGSMQEKDFGDEEKTRFDVAKKEAIRFIKKRENDPMGVVIFGKSAISRCPMTLDKTILKNIVNNLYIGFVDPDGTVLSTAVLMAANRLKDSESKNKVMILLTDGAPTENDVDPNLAVEVAKKLGIKIYTIGIGSDEPQYRHHPFYGYIAMPGVNKKLLKQMAKTTGGKFFMAKNPKDMRRIYETIDKLEKTEHETNIYSRYFDVFLPFLWVVFIFVLLELFLTAFLWFGL